MSPRPTGSEKVRENRLRRMAERQGYVLIRSRRRDPLAVDYGKYYLVHARTNTPACRRDGCDLDQVEEFLARETVDS